MPAVATDSLRARLPRRSSSASTTLRRWFERARSRGIKARIADIEELQHPLETPGDGLQVVTGSQQRLGALFDVAHAVADEAGRPRSCRLRLVFARAAEA
jgi:sugar phosphate isomerase/epimerase